MATDRAKRRDLSRVLALLLVGALLGGADPAAARPGPGPQAAASARLTQCASCHQPDGVSRAEIFPNLAGQQNDYLVAQLTAFRDHTRQDRDAKSYMWGVAAGLTDAAIRILAADYAVKPAVVAASGENDHRAAGEAIFAKGVAAHGVLACASCHGPHGEGNGAFPRLAGQHDEYLRVQLRAYASGSRDNAAMHLIAKSMTPGELRDVADYLSSR